MSEKIRASDIRHGMAKRWAAPEWAIMWEVGEGTGARALSECGPMGYARLVDRLRKAADEIEAIQAMSNAEGVAAE